MTYNLNENVKRPTLNRSRRPDFPLKDSATWLPTKGNNYIFSLLLALLRTTLKSMYSLVQYEHGIRSC
jgi:hypothetical protein